MLSVTSWKLQVPCRCCARGCGDPALGQLRGRTGCRACPSRGGPVLPGLGTSRTAQAGTEVSPCPGGALAVGTGGSAVQGRWGGLQAAPGCCVHTELGIWGLLTPQ